MDICDRRHSQCKDTWLDSNCHIHRKEGGVAGVEGVRAMRGVLYDIRESAGALSETGSHWRIWSRGTA